jgi:hypothetical protein
MVDLIYRLALYCENPASANDTIGNGTTERYFKAVLVRMSEP